MTKHPDELAMYDSLSEFVATERRLNESRAADAARAAIASLTAETGLPAASGLQEALTWKLFQAMNAELDAAAARIAEPSAGSTLH